MARLAPKALNLSDCERLELQQLLNRHQTPQQLVRRAKIILLASDGKNHREIARTLDINRQNLMILLIYILVLLNATKAESGQYRLMK